GWANAGGCSTWGDAGSCASGPVKKAQAQAQTAEETSILTRRPLLAHAALSRVHGPCRAAPYQNSLGYTTYWPWFANYLVPVEVTEIEKTRPVRARSVTHASKWSAATSAPSSLARWQPSSAALARYRGSSRTVRSAAAREPADTRAR